MTTRTVLHLFSGSGGGALGFKRAGFRSVGALDYDPAACRDHDYLTGETSTVADLATMTPAELRRIVGERRPDVVFTSSPCVGLSMCLPEEKARTDKYQGFNDLAVRGVWLVLQAWPEQPPPVILFENVPAIAASRGKRLLRELRRLLSAAGYLFDMRTHDCGEIGGLAQHRRRFLLLARDPNQVPAFICRPPTQRVRAIGEVLGDLPTPDMSSAKRGKAQRGDMHRQPTLSVLNWIRLALIPAGKDWKAIPPVVRLVATDIEVEPRWPENASRHDGKLGVLDPNEPAHTILGNSRPCQAWSSTADPRLAHEPRRGTMGVLDTDEPAPTIRGHHEVRQAQGAIADPRLVERASRKNGGYGVERWDDASRAVLAEGSVSNTPVSVADPRITCDQRSGSYGVVDFDEPAGTIVGHHKHDRAPASVADPRVPWPHEVRKGRPHCYGVADWERPSGVIRGRHEVCNTTASVADPRWPTPTHWIVMGEDGVPEIHGPALDIASKRPCYLVIRALDGCWHRPMTDLELAVIQGFPAYHAGEMLALEGPSGARRKHIGNAVPPGSAEAIALEVKAALEAAADGFRLVGGGMIWVEREEERADADHAR